MSCRRTTCAGDLRTIVTMSALDLHSGLLTRAARFALVGASNTAVGLGLIWLAWHGLGWPDLPANLLGYGAGFLWSYALNRRWTFQHRGPLARSFGRFALVCGFAYAVNLVVLALARAALGPATFWPHVLGMVAYTILGFLGSQYYAFYAQRSVRSAP
jgi:putative flippase GtrA